jgi:choloylglycine hydrolase
VAVPFGAVDTSGGESTDAWPTRWGAVTDLTHKIYYVMPVSTPAVFWVDLGKLDPKSSAILAADPYDIRLSGDVSAQLKSFASVQRPFPPAP